MYKEKKGFRCFFIILIMSFVVFNLQKTQVVSKYTTTHTPYLNDVNYFWHFIWEKLLLKKYILLEIVLFFWMSMLCMAYALFKYF